MTESPALLLPDPWRRTTQALAPLAPAPAGQGRYDLYPAWPVGSGKIEAGFAALARRLVGQRRVVLDGYGGVFWDHFRAHLDEALRDLGVQAAWTDVRAALREAADVERLVRPFLGGDDPLFGTRFTGTLGDFFDPDRLAALQPDPAAALHLVYGCGAALSGWEGFYVYVDVPKNEIQFRSRAGTVTCLGAAAPASAKGTYKRCYFVDWVALNRHKAALLPRLDLVVDAQRPDEPALMAGEELRAALHVMGRNAFRVRPWFEPGPWGGQWIKQHVPALPQEAPNYAWSFELIAPENGLAFESDGRRLEVSFDVLLYQEHRAVLGDCADVFGFAFPIRFDFLDTVGGGNLSVQCHPRPEYIQAHFGERFTQDETYYMLDAEPGARVYLGFQEDADPGAFREALEASFREGTPVDVERFVQTHPARKHDLFLIPSGTVHCAGEGGLVLEISATPYIFTFKMYDWLRLGLDGQPRPLNIGRAFENLRFERRGARVAEAFISKPCLLDTGPDWQLVHLPTHADHFYDVHRFDFATTVEADTRGAFHVMNLVEGTSVLVETVGGQQRFSYAETFVVPAAAGAYRLINEGPEVARVVKAFVKPDVAVQPERYGIAPPDFPA